MWKRPPFGWPFLFQKFVFDWCHRFEWLQIDASLAESLIKPENELSELQLMQSMREIIWKIEISTYSWYKSTNVALFDVRLGFYTEGQGVQICILLAARRLSKSLPNSQLCGALQVHFDYLIDNNWGFNFDVKELYLWSDFDVTIGGAQLCTCRFWLFET